MIVPIIVGGKDTYLMKLNQVINTIVDIDLAYIASYNSVTALKEKPDMGNIRGAFVLNRLKPEGQTTFQSGYLGFYTK